MEKKKNIVLSLFALASLFTALFLWTALPAASESSEWTLTVHGRAIETYPDLKESIWIQNRPPYGPYDKIDLHRVMKASVKSRGAVLLLPGTYSNADRNLWTARDEKYSLFLYLANRNFDVYTMSYRSHYVPPELEQEDLLFMADWGWDKLISDMKECVNLIKQVSGAKKIYLGGMSFGGTATMNYSSLFWDEDLKGILLLDGGNLGKDPANVTNTYNLPARIDLMIANKTIGGEPRGPGAIFVLRYADEHPDAPAVDPFTGVPLQPTINPRTGQPWTNILEYIVYNWLYLPYARPGGLSNIYEDFGDPRRGLHAQALYDRWWPSRLGLETSAISNWDNCPYVTNDFDDLFYKIDVPAIGFKSGLNGATTPYIYGIANPDITAFILPGYGHVDVFYGNFAAQDMYSRLCEWMSSRRMLVGVDSKGGGHKRGHKKEATIFINENSIDFKLADGSRASWNVVSHDYCNPMLDSDCREKYEGEGERGRIQIIIDHSNGKAVAVGPGIHFIGNLY